MSENLDSLLNQLLGGSQEKKEEKKEEQKSKQPETSQPQLQQEPTRTEQQIPEVQTAQPKFEKPEPVTTKPLDTKPPEPKKEPIKVITIKDDEFDFTEETELGKEVHLIYGFKGHGKTAFAMSYPGKIAVLSFDRKSTAVKYLYQDRMDEIKVWNAVKYMDYTSPEAELVSAEKTFRYLVKLLDQVIRQWEPDWVVIDGSEILSHICELVMRYRNGLMPFQGIANLNLWKERKMYLRQIHYLALDVAKRGVIYTAYVDKDEVIEDGEIRAKRDVPRWLDILVYETDVVIRVLAQVEKGAGTKFYAIVESSKVPYIKTGVQADITNKKGFDEIVRLSKVGVTRPIFRR